MGSTSRTGRAVINPTAPSALGICDRCGFQYNLRDLRHQYDWCGTRMQNLQIKVCATCYDRPQEQKRTIILPPDPLPVSGPRTEPFFLDEINHLTLRAPIGKMPWLRGIGSIDAVLTVAETGTIGASISGVGAVAAELTVQANTNLAALVSGLANVAAVLTHGQAMAAAIGDTGNVAAAVTRGHNLAAAIGSTGNVAAELTQGVLKTRIYLAADVSGGQITIPSDYTNTGAVWHAIGGSVDPTDPSAGASAGGCGGGAYSGNNVGLVFTPGASVSAQIGKGDVWVSNTGSAPTTTSEGVLAKGGVTNATNGAGGAGGASASGVGTTKFSGGNGGTGSGTNFGGAGGGGAAGPSGVGRNGGNNAAQTSGAGGGGSNGGSSTAGASAQSSTLGGAGGHGTGGTGGGAAGSSGNGGNGSDGGGGGGGGGASGVGGNGSMQVIWTDNSGGPNDGATAGPGGGGGAGGGSSLGGSGGTYGGGCGGEGEAASGAGTGTNGVLVVQYYGSSGGPDELLQENGDKLLLENSNPIEIDQWQGDVSAASALDGTEQIAVVQGGVTERTTIANAVTKLRGF